MQKITACLWFDGQAEEAAEFYISVFGSGRIIDKAYYGKAGPGPEGTVMAVRFEVNGQEFTGLNGGPEFHFTEAVSFQVSCKDQEETDYFWNRLTEGGEEVTCGWLKDRFGLSWQVVPDRLLELVGDPDPERAERAMQAMLEMKRIDIEAVEKAAAG